MTDANSMAAPQLGKSSKNKIRKDLVDHNLASSALIEEIHDTRNARTAIRLVALALLTFIVWAAYAPVTEIAEGHGEIIPAGGIQNVQHFEGGIIAEIFVSEGQTVSKGQPILRLDDISVRAELAKASARSEGIKREIERRGNTEATSFKSVFDGELRLRGIANSQQAAARAESAFQQAQIQVILAERQTRQGELSTLISREEKYREELDILSRQLADFKTAQKIGAISKRELDNIARDKIQLEGILLDVGGQITNRKTALIESDAHLQELRAGFRQNAETAIADLEIEAANVQELISQLVDRLKRTTILAPNSGRLHQFSARNSGQIIGPGEQIAEIIPDGEIAIAEVEIPADQIGFISLGMEANVKVLTYDHTRFGTVPATVTNISASNLKHEANSTSYFLVRVELARNNVGDSAADYKILPGMSIIADVVLGEKTVLDFLLKPLRSLSDRALSEQ